MKSLGAGELRQLEDVGGPDTGARHDRDSVSGGVDQRSQYVLAHVDIRSQTTGEDPGATQLDDLFQRSHRVLHAVERPVKRHLHRTCPPDQLRASLDIDVAVLREHSDHHTVATQESALLYIGERCLKLQVGEKEVTATRPDDRAQFKGGVPPGHRDHAVGRGSAPFFWVGTQFNPVGTVGLRYQT